MPRLTWISLMLLLTVSCRGPSATQALTPDTAIAPARPAITETRPPQTATATPTPAEEPAGAATPTPLPSRTPTRTAAPRASATQAGSAEPGPAVAVILDYLETRARADVAGVSDLSCAAWRSQAVTEAISFRAMQAVLEDVTCQAAGSAGPFTLVTCEGKIITTYGGEQREWDLAGFVYQATVEDDAWKMCGYQS